MNQIFRPLVVLLPAIGFLLGAETTGQTATISVLNTNDAGAGSLRAAVAAAAAGDTINFASGVTGAVNLSSGAIQLSQDIKLFGPGAGQLTLNGNASNIFSVVGGSALIADLTLSNGFFTNGAAIRMTGGSLMISNAVLANNSAAPGQGGRGGAVYVSGGNLAAVRSTFNGNRANLGGGIYNNGGQIALTNCTFTANEATIAGASGAAIYNETGSTITVQSCTIASNTITAGFGSAAGIRNNGSAIVCSTIIFGNSGPSATDLSGAFVSGGYNLIGNASGSTGFTNGITQDLVGANPLLGPLQNNGGTTPTMALSPASPAVDHGISGGLTTDQRGQPRPFDNLLAPNASGGDGADIGSYESSLVVVNNNDSGAGSLRQAILDNNAAGGGNTIGFAANVTGTIALTTGELLATKDVALAGPGDKTLALSGNNASRVLHFTNGTTAQVSGLAIIQGRGAMGGALLQDSGKLTLSLCTLSSNFSTLQGGALAVASGTTTVSQCSFLYNRGTNDGGAIFQATGSLSVASCTLAYNSSSIRGGAITINPDATAAIFSSTLASNSATFGGALMLYPVVRITNSTFSGNTATFGGAIDNFATATTTMRNCIVAGNIGSAGGPDCMGTFVSAGFNLIGATNDSSGWTGTGDQRGSSASPLNPLLGPLRANGGPMMTMALRAGSPAIDKGSSGTAQDQRGAPRPFDFASVVNAAGGDGSDVGAFELATPTLTIGRANDTSVVLSWPGFYGDYGLESTATVGSPSWIPTGDIPVLIGNQYVVGRLDSGAPAFFRLSSF